MKTLIIDVVYISIELSIKREITCIEYDSIRGTDNS